MTIETDYATAASEVLRDSLKEHFRTARPTELQKLYQLGESTPFLVALVILASFAFDLPVPMLDRVPLVRDIIGDGPVFARQFAAFVPGALFVFLAAAYWRQRLVSYKLAAVLDQILVLVHKHRWRLAEFVQLREDALGLGKTAGLYKFERTLLRKWNLSADRRRHAAARGEDVAFDQYQQLFAEQEFERQIHAYQYLPKERGYLPHRQTFDPLLLIFRPYDPHFVAAFPHSIDPELHAFAVHGDDPRRMLRPRLDADDTKWRWSQFLFLATLQASIIGAAGAWALVLTNLASGWMLLNVGLVVTVIAVPIHWNYHALIRKRGFPKAVRLMEAGRTLLHL